MHVLTSLAMPRFTGKNLSVFPQLLGLSVGRYSSTLPVVDLLLDWAGERNERIRLAVVPQCNIPREPGGRALSRGIFMHFPQTRSLAPTMAQKAFPIAAGVVVASVASILLNRSLARKAERRNPPLGRFITVGDVRLHYLERGTGTPLILLHGNGSMIQDFQSSGLIDLAANTNPLIG
jgi:hypothetical protein